MSWISTLGAHTQDSYAAIYQRNITKSHAHVRRCHVCKVCFHKNSRHKIKHLNTSFIKYKTSLSSSYLKLYKLSSIKPILWWMKIINVSTPCTVYTTDMHTYSNKCTLCKKDKYMQIYELCRFSSMLVTCIAV